LQLLLANEKFVAEDFQKIEYNWDTEFLKPPKWLKNQSHGIGWWLRKL
jgi:hypothetical protein